MKNAVFTLKNNNNLVFEKVNDDYCLFNENTGRMAVLNITAGKLFEYIKNNIDEGKMSFRFEEFVECFEKQFELPADSLSTVNEDIKSILQSFKNEQFFIFVD